MVLNTGAKKGPETVAAPDQNQIFNILPQGIMSPQRYKTFPFPANFRYLWSADLQPKHLVL